MLLIYILLISAVLSTRNKTCVEIIDYGFSEYIINWTIYDVHACMATGYGHHNIGALSDEFFIRLYTYPYHLFPAVIYRDANNYTSNPIDKYLVFAKEYVCDTHCCTVM